MVQKSRLSVPVQHGVHEKYRHRYRVWSRALQARISPWHDIDGARLATSEKVAHRIAETTEHHHRPIEIARPPERLARCTEAPTFVITMRDASRRVCARCTVIDFDIPEKFGLRQTIGDTLGSWRY